MQPPVTVEDLEEWRAAVRRARSGVHEVMGTPWSSPAARSMWRRAEGCLDDLSAVEGALVELEAAAESLEAARHRFEDARVREGLVAW